MNNTDKDYYREFCRCGELRYKCICKKDSAPVKSATKSLEENTDNKPIHAIDKACEVYGGEG